MNGSTTKPRSVVVDSSFIVDLLAGVPGVAASASRFGTVQFHAPHLLDLEFSSSIRGAGLGRKLSNIEGIQMIERLTSLQIVRHPHRLFLARIWQLRDNISAYDACYVALAEWLDAPLLTRDLKLARSPGHAARVEYID